jgi:hypothetical protein
MTEVHYSTFNFVDLTSQGGLIKFTTWMIFYDQKICAGNVTAIPSTDLSNHSLHIRAPIIYNNLQGKPTNIVGNADSV